MMLGQMPAVNLFDYSFQGEHDWHSRVISGDATISQKKNSASHNDMIMWIALPRKQSHNITTH